jgi:signal peptidase I
MNKGKKKYLKSQKSAKPNDKGKEKKVKKSFGRRLWEFVKDWTTVIIIVLVIRAFGIESMVVPTGSMENTILPGDFLLVNKFVYGFKAPFFNTEIIPGRDPVKDDIIVFRYPHHPRYAVPEDQYARLYPRWLPLLPLHWDKVNKKLKWYMPENWVKRCVGVAGDTVEIVNKQLYVNGVRFDDAGKAIHKDPHIFPAVVPREQFEDRWMELLCFLFADSLYYADSTAYLGNPGFHKVSFSQLRHYYDSLFNAAYYQGALDENHYQHYLVNFYMHKRHYDYLNQSRMPMTLPLPPEGDNDHLAFYNRFYAETYADSLYGLDSFYFANFITHYYMRDNFGPIVVPEGMVMGIGDNRDESHDCRFWGFVPLEMLKGSPVVYYYSLGDETDAAGNKRSIPARILNTHWDRIGKTLK